MRILKRGIIFERKIKMYVLYYTLLLYLDMLIALWSLAVSFLWLHVLQLHVLRLLYADELQIYI